MQIKLGVMRYGTTGSIGETWQDLGQQAAVQKLTSIHLSFEFSIYNTVSDNPIQFFTQMLTWREFQGFTSLSTPDDTSSLATLDDQKTFWNTWWQEHFVHSWWWAFCRNSKWQKNTLVIPDGKSDSTASDDKSNAATLGHKFCYSWWQEFFYTFG